MDRTNSHSNAVPTIIETESGKVQAMDIWTSLLQDRILTIYGAIDDSLANVLCPALLILEKQDPNKEIRLFINSPGGSITAGLAIIDTMNYIRPDIRVVCQGQAASMAAVILAAGTKGKRLSMPLSTIMIHQPWVSGLHSVNATELAIEAKQMERMRQTICQLLAKGCNKKLDQVLADCENDNYMSATEALNYGIIDKLTNKSKAKKEE